MRKSLVPIALAALFLLPAGALATRGAALKDGTLSVKGGVGMVYVNARGAVIGRVDKATRITIIDFVEDDGGLPVLQGCDTPETAGATDDGEGIKTSCSGNKIRFRLLGGKYSIRISGAKGIDLSAVGKGKVELRGQEGLSDDGTYSVDGGEPKSLPEKLAKFTLGS